MRRIIFCLAVIFIFALFLPFPEIHADSKESTIPTTVPQKVRVPALAFDEKSIILVWNKPDTYANVKDYNVYMNGKLLGSSSSNNDKVSPAKPYINKFYADDKSNFHIKISIHSYTVTNLKPDTEYIFTVRSVFKDGKESLDSSPVRQMTASMPKIFNIKDFGAKGDGKTINTKAIQNAIDACTPNGKVVIPAGVFKSGAIFLKSNMTLEISGGGTLLGSERSEDYPLKRGYRLYTYSSADRPPSLINALADSREPGAFTDIRIVGKGMIDGNGWERTSQNFIIDEAGKQLPQYPAVNDVSAAMSFGILAKAQLFAVVQEGLDPQKLFGQRRSSLITMRGVRNLYYADITCVNPAFHGVMNLQCENVVMNGVVHKTYDIANADGIEFGNCNNIMVFNNLFDTGDDCVNFAAGTGSDAEKQQPMQNAFIFNNYFREGHGAVVLGSHTGAWIQNILAEDNIVNGTNVALRCKSTLIVGGGGRNVMFRDTAVKNYTRQAYVFTLDYFDPNSLIDYKPAERAGQFRDITVQNNSVENIQTYFPVIQVKGDIAKKAYHENISFINVYMKNVIGVKIDGLKGGHFRDVDFRSLKDDSEPWSIQNSEGLAFEGITRKPK